MYTINNYDYVGIVAGISAFSSMIGVAACVCIIIGLWKCFVKAGKPGWHALVPFLNIYTLFEVAWTKKTGIAVIVVEASGIFLYLVGGIMVGVSAYAHGFSPFMDWDRLDYANLPVTFVIGTIIYTFAAITVAVGAILTCVCFVKLGQSFGKRGGFNVGLFLVAPVFLMILGLGRDQYIGTPYRRATGPYVSPNQSYQNNYYQNNNNQNNYNQNNYNQNNNQNDYNQQYQNPNNQGQPNPDMYNQAPPNPNMYDQSGSDPAPEDHGKSVCPHCGKPITSGDKFCAACGGPLV